MFNQYFNQILQKILFQIKPQLSLMPNRISKSFTKEQWLTMREELKDKGIADKNWQSAIRIIHERVTERYFNPIQVLIDDTTRITNIISR